MSEKKPCAVFSVEEIRELRRIPWGLRLIIGLFVAIVALIFVPFQTVNQLSTQVGSIVAIQTERRGFYEKEIALQMERIKKIEDVHAAFSKKFYWIDRHSRETHEKVREILRRMSAGRSGDILELSRRPAGIPSAR